MAARIVVLEEQTDETSGKWAAISCHPAVKEMKAKNRLSAESV